MPTFPLLEPKQLNRIRGLHRGILYQHLWAVGCLLRGAANGTSEVHVERDEDIEVFVGDLRVYVQIKTKNNHFVPSDIADAVAHLLQLREREEANGSLAHARFLIVLNAEPSPTLNAQLSPEGYLHGIFLLHPSTQLPADWPQLPPAWGGLVEAMVWCSAQAEQIPFRMLQSETLVKKLATAVSMASAGAGVEDHVFKIDKLETLFEQLVVSMQNFPEPPSLYRPQTDEPDFFVGPRVRIVTGHSGAGKTAWAAESAAHSQDRMLYFDVSGLSQNDVINGLARELAAQLIGATAIPFQEVLLPGTGGGPDCLRRLEQHFRTAHISATVVMDNVHLMDPEVIRTVTSLVNSLRFLLLGHPGDAVSRMGALLDVSGESLQGWDANTVALELASRGCFVTVESSRRLRSLTGGLPLFVRGAATGALNENRGDIAAFCDALDKLSHGTQTEQEIILSRTFASLDESSRRLLSVLSLSDQPLSKVDTLRWITPCLDIDEEEFHRHLRTFSSLGIIQYYTDQRLKVHDSIRILGRQELDALGAELRTSAWQSLRDMLIETMGPHDSAARTALIVRAYEALGDFDSLADMIDQEILHERGVTPQIASAIKAALASGGYPIRSRFKAYNGLVLAAMKFGPDSDIPDLIGHMRALVETRELGKDALLDLLHKEGEYHADHGDKTIAESALNQLGMLLETDDDSSENRSFFRAVRYSRAKILHSLGHDDEALAVSKALVEKFLRALGIPLQALLGADDDSFSDMVGQSVMSDRDLLHCANALELFAIVLGDRTESINPLYFALRLFVYCDATDSIVKAGTNFADSLIRMDQFDGALKAMEQYVLPNLDAHGMAWRTPDVVGLHAVALAYCGRFDDADITINTLAPFEKSMSKGEQEQLHNQRRIIANLRDKGRVS